MTATLHQFPKKLNTLQVFRATYGGLKYDYDFCTSEEKKMVSKMQEVYLQEMYLDPLAVACWLMMLFEFSSHEASEILTGFEMGEIIFAIAYKDYSNRITWIEMAKKKITD